MAIFSDFLAEFRSCKMLKENLFIARYCIKESHRMGRQLVVVAIDFENSFEVPKRYFLCGDGGDSGAFCDGVRWIEVD